MTTRVLFLLCVFLPSWGYAQIVNVFSGVPLKPPQGWGASSDVVFSWRTGNSDVLNAGLGGQVYLQKKAHFASFSTRYRVVMQSGKKSVNQIYEHLRYRYGLSDRFFLESYLQHEWDSRLLLDTRFLTGGGVRWLCVDSKHWGLALGVAYLLEYERLQKPSPGQGMENTNTRVSTYAQLTYAWDDRVSLQNVVFAQPRVTPGRLGYALGDVLLLQETALVVRLNARLNLKTGWMIRHDTRPPEGLHKTDTLFETSLGWVL